MKTFAVLGLLLLGAGIAFAEPPAPAVKPADRMAVDAQVSQRISQMHARLKITPAQEGDWDAFAQVMRDNVTSTGQAYEARRASIATMSAPENMRNFAQIEQDRAAGIEKLAAAFQTVYDSMSDDQKTIADSMFRHHVVRHEGRKPAPTKPG